MNKFNPGPIFATFICCIWPIICHLVWTRGRGWISSLRSRVGGKSIRMGRK